MFQPRVLVAALIAIPLMLTGCTMSANLTTSAASVAEQAAKALQDQLGTPEPPKMDCGTEPVPLVNDTVVDCLLTDVDTDLEYDATVTLSEVDGTKFRINVQVADTANNAADAPAEEPAAEYSVPSADLATLAAGALEPQLGYSPLIHCSEADVPLIVEESIRCMLTDDAGAQASVLITITEVDGAEYRINAKVQ